jgi:hypothetical protein
MLILSAKGILDASGIFRKPDWFDNLLIMIFFGLFGIKMMTQRYTFLSLAVRLALIMISAYTCFTVKYFFLLFSSVTLCSMQDVDLTRTMLASARMKAVIIIIHAASYIFDLIFRPETVVFAYRRGIKRMTFNLGHPNTFSMYAVWAILEYIYADYRKMTWWKLGILWLINYVIYYYCNSNSSMITMTMVCLMVLILKYGKGFMLRAFKTVLSVVSKYMFLFVGGGVTVLIIGFANNQLVEVFRFFDELFTNRLLFGAVSYDTYGVSVLGRLLVFSEKLFWHGYWIDEVYMDNGYISMIVKDGIVYMILIGIAIAVVSSRLAVYEKIFIFAYALYTLMEAYALNTSFVFPMLIVGRYLCNPGLDGREDDTENV